MKTQKTVVFFWAFVFVLTLAITICVFWKSKRVKPFHTEAEVYREDITSLQNLPATMDNLKMEAKQENAEVQTEEAKAQQNLSVSLDSLKTKAEQGNAEAQYRLGQFYLGIGNSSLDSVNVGFAEMAEWFMKSAQQGHAKAQFNLGLFYLGGTGVDRDVAHGVEWLTKSATQGEDDAQYILGLLYLKNSNVAREHIGIIVKNISEAAKQGNVQAKSSLGLLLLMEQDNIEINGDTSTAFGWLKKSAEQGNAHTQTIIGLFYEKGIGVETNIDEAIKWYRNATEQGDKSAEERLLQMESE